MTETASALVKPANLGAPCLCTVVKQDETCPIGYPSLLCEICHGKGVVPSPRAQALEEAARVAEAYIGGEHEAQGRAAEEIASELRALSSQPVDQEAKDFEAIGRAFMSCFDVITTEGTEWDGYTPAECPSELVMDIFAAQQELKSSLPLTDGWLPIETAPKDGTCVLVWKPDEPRVGEYICVAYWDDAIIKRTPQWVDTAGRALGYLSKVDGKTQGYPTHWRPLPTPPSSEVA